MVIDMQKYNQLKFIIELLNDFNNGLKNSFLAELLLQLNKSFADMLVIELEPKEMVNQIALR